MIKIINSALYFSIILNSKLTQGNNSDKPTYIYKPYTTSTLLSNQDMYDVDQIVRDAFIVKEE